MRSGALTVRPARSRHVASVQITWREWWCGLLTCVGLTWLFVVPSLTPLRWWMLLPCAVLAGALRQAHGRRLSWPLVPLYALCAIYGLFVAYGFATDTLNDYGQETAGKFAALMGLALLAGYRQAPLTADFLRGLRHGLLVTLGLCLIVIVLKRELYLNPGDTGLDELTETVSTTGLPLVLALAACALITVRVTADRLFYSGVGLLGTAVLSVLVRGRFDALLLLALAAVVVLGPPWRDSLWRLVLVGVMVVVAVAVVVFVLPNMGDSYTYLERLDRGLFASRSDLYAEAWNGFLRQPLGHGIGTFAWLEPAYQYPHNLVLEVAYELGLFGLLAVLTLYGLALLRILSLWANPAHRLPAALLIIIFLHILKAGNIATFAFQWGLAYTLFVATPLAVTVRRLPSEVTSWSRSDTTSPNSLR